MGVRACSLRVDGRGSGCRLCNFRVWGQRLVGRVRIENTVRRERNHLSIAYIQLQQPFSFPSFVQRLKKSYLAGYTVEVRLCLAARYATPATAIAVVSTFANRGGALRCRSFSMGISPLARCCYVLFFSSLRSSQLDASCLSASFVVSLPTPSPLPSMSNNFKHPHSSPNTPAPS